jgi:GNAT superfamily N-acetyltransferase
MKIRAAALDDSDALAALSTELGYPTSPDVQRTRLELLLNRLEHAVFVAEMDGRVIGWLHVFLRPLVESDSAAEIGGLVVAEGFRRHGAGRALVAVAERWAAAHGAQRLAVRCNAQREVGNRFYAALGFSTTKTQTVWRKAVRA